MTIHPDGIPCGCGNRGCREQYSSASALIRMAKAEEMGQAKDSILWKFCDGGLSKVEGKTAFQAAGMGDATAKQILNTYLAGLSIGIANPVNILQPEIICLGGGISQAGDDLLLNPLKQLVYQNVFDKNAPSAH